MRHKAHQASLHGDPAVNHLGDFIDILLDDLEQLISDKENETTHLPPAA